MAQKLKKIIYQAQPKPAIKLTDKQLASLKTTSDIILATVLIAGAVSIAFIAPGLLKAVYNLKKFNGLSRGQRQDKAAATLRRSLYYLKNKGLARIEEKNGELFLIVTEKGRKQKKRLEFETLAVERSAKWNGSWWLVTADIPTKLRSAATRFHGKLKEMGFFPLQRTVWLYPFDPRNEIDFVSTYLDIQKFVTFMEINKLQISDQKIAVRHFKQLKIL